MIIIVCIPLMGCRDKSKQVRDFDLENLANPDQFHMSHRARHFLTQNGFVIIRGKSRNIADMYKDCRKKNHPIFITTDAVLHTTHACIKNVIRLVESENLYPLIGQLTDRMLELSENQYNETLDNKVKTAAWLNMGYFGVAKKILDSTYRTGGHLDKLVKDEILNIEMSTGLLRRPLLDYVSQPTPMYATEDYGRFLPQDHYRQNELFKKYFKVLTWYENMAFKLKPGVKKTALAHGRMMTLQALLMTDAVVNDREAHRLWTEFSNTMYYFMGKAGDPSIDNYHSLSLKVFQGYGPVDRFGDKKKLEQFIQEELSRKGLFHFIEEIMSLKKLRKMLGIAVSVGDDELLGSMRGFHFMDPPLLPDHYVFYMLSTHWKDNYHTFLYSGVDKPFTMGNIPGVGSARIFPRGLDLMAVLGSERAFHILKENGDMEYAHFQKQLEKVRHKFTHFKQKDWEQNLHWHRLYILKSILNRADNGKVPEFMKSPSWADKELQTALGSWVELRHDVISLPKSNIDVSDSAEPPESTQALGFVEPCPDVYARIHDMVENTREHLDALGITHDIAIVKLKALESLAADLTVIAQKELQDESLTPEEYEMIRTIGDRLAEIEHFPRELVQKTGVDTDTNMVVATAVHDDPFTWQVLEEGLGAPSDIYVVVEDQKGRRICRGGVFSYFEFKYPFARRLSDEAWREMVRLYRRPPQPSWTKIMTSDQ